MESKRMCLKSYIRKLYYEKKISNDEMKCLLEKLEGHDKHLIRNERKSAIDCFTNRLSEYLGVENAAKYGNKYAEQQRNSYSTMMMYEVADLVDDLIEIVKQEAEKFGSETNVGCNCWIPVDEELPETDKYILLSFSNFSIPCVGRYEEDENGGAFYVGYDNETCVSQDMFVNAWMNIPSPYQPKGE